MGSLNEYKDSNLAVLRAVYSSKLPLRLQEIEKSAGRLCDSQSQEDRVCAQSCLAELAHRLSGSAGTFGYAKISTLAQRLETICRQIRDESVDEKIISFVKRLKDAADEGPDQFVTEAPVVVSLPQGHCLHKQAQRPIFLIEDDLLVSQEIKRQLSMFGFFVQHLIEPQMLEEALLHVQAEAIIMDIAFPKANDAGISVVKKLRDEGKINCPVIYLSVLDDFQTRLKAVHSGCDAYLVKPVDPIELVDILNRMSTHLSNTPLQVFIVDDCQETAHFYAKILNNRQMLTQVETDPLNAMEALKTYHPDLVLMDINMPGCNGVDLSSVIRQHRDLLQIPIVFTTSTPSIDIHMEALRAGGDGFLEKPVEPDILYSAIAQRAKRYRHLKMLMAHVGESEARFRDLAEGSNQGIVIHRKFRPFFVNAAAAKIFGYDGPEEILSLDTLLDLRDPKEHVKHRKFMKARMSDDEAPQTYESKGVRKDGGLVWTENHVRVVIWGGCKATQTTIIDITERKTAEEELLKMSRRNQLILDTAGEGIFGINVKDEFIFINPAAAKMLNLDPAKAIGQDCQEFVNHGRIKDERASIILSFWNGGQQGKPQEHTNNDLIIRHDGTCFPVEYVSTPIRDAANNITGAVCVFRDVSKMRETQSQLMHISKLASLDEMASGMAHEINQPLNIIRMVTENTIEEILGESCSEKSLIERLEKISKQTERAAAIIDHMRIFGRKSDENLKPFSLIKAANDTLVFLREQYRLNEIDLVCDFPENCRMVFGNKVQLEQVLINIFNNARDSILSCKSINEHQKGQISLKIDDVDCQDQVSLLISDNGGGIPMGILKRIFDPFFTTKDVGKGMGLGLSISHGIIKAMGGDLKAESSSSGAQFVISLPSVDAS